MTTWFVSRHPGALAWASQHGIQIDRPIDHLDIAAIEPRDQVIGTLPIHMAAAVCELGARYFHLEISIPRELRGEELDAEQLEALGARLTEFRVQRCVSAIPTPELSGTGQQNGIDQQHAGRYP